MARENPAAYFQSFQGAHKACVLEHIPFGVLLDENVTVEMMQQYPVVCLANTGIVSQRELALLRDYVTQGGHLLITGQTGQYDALGQPLANTSLSELIGASVVRRLESADNWIRFPTLRDDDAQQTAQSRQLAAQLQGELPSDWPFLVEGPATVYQPTTAVPVGELMTPHRMPRQLRGELVTDWPMSADQPVGPAILVNKVGNGTVVTFAASPDFATASEHHLVETRQLFCRAVRLLHPATRRGYHGTGQRRGGGHRRRGATHAARTPDCLQSDSSDHARQESSLYPAGTGGGSADVSSVHQVGAPDHGSQDAQRNHFAQTHWQSSGPDD